MKVKSKTYHENFIAGTRMLMAKENISNTREAAEILEIGYMALYKILDGSNKPTAELGITLCKKAGYSANWLFLNKGEIFYQDEADIGKLMKNLKALRSEISAAGVPLKTR